jgi:hypothetical protein
MRTRLPVSVREAGAVAAAVAMGVALVAASSGIAADRVVERGIVQSIDATTVVLRALDGTDVTVALGPSTRLRLNGTAASLEQIRPGLVAEVVTVGPGPARVLRAFGRVEPRIERGALVRLRAAALVLRRDGGGRIEIPLGGRTTVLRAGRPARLRSLRPGMQLEVVLAANGSARVVRVLGPGR